MAESREDRETNRLEAFSDGVFAFAITLLVLDLRVPRLDEDLRAKLREESLAVLALVITFATIYVLWTNHHALFRRVHHVNGFLLYSNGLILLLVSVAAFPTAFLAEFLGHANERLAAAVYAAWLLCVNVAFNLLVMAIEHGHHRAEHGFGDLEVHRLQKRMRFGFAAYAGALVLALWSAWATVAVCLVLWVYWLFRAFEGHRRAPA